MCLVVRGGGVNRSEDSRDEPLRRQILDKSNFVQGKLGGYQQMRPSMKRAFAAVSCCNC